MNDDLKKLATVICSKTSMGTSSKTILAYCTGTDYFCSDRPYDKGDLSRCIYLLSEFPNWKEKIKHISERFPEWGKIGENWELVEKSYYKRNSLEISELLDSLSKDKEIYK